nr:retrovirus-related Pol polyprotein from transposon TNT 1-94 [Tanacetum cinerariifolium]
MSRDVITVGSTMWISLLYRGEYSQWSERFMNYLKEKTDGEAMINSIQNDPKFWTAEEKKTRKIDRLARSLLIQGLPNDIYSLIDSNETAKDLWDALERQMCGSEYAEQDRKAAILFLNNLEPEWKQYGTLMRQTKIPMDINIDALYNILKQNQGDVNDALGYKKKAVVITSDPLALVAKKTKVSKRKEKVVVSSNFKGSGADDFNELKKITCLLEKAFNRRKFYSKPTNNNLRTSSTSQSANKKQEFVKRDDKKDEKKVDEKKRDMRKVKCYNCKKEGHFTKDCKKAKVKDYNYYKTKMLLAKKDSDEQVLLAEDQAWMESNSDSDQEINANMVFMAQTEKVLSDLDESSSSAEETIAEFDKMSRQLVEMNNRMLRLQEKILEKETKISELEGCVSNKDVEIEKYLERLNECENKLHKIGQTNQTIHMIMPSKDTLYNGRKGIGFENPSYFEKAKDLRPSLYDEKVIGLGYTLMFLIHSDEALEIKKFKRARENKIKFANNYGNLNASYVNEKINFSDDYFQEIINPDFEKIDSLFQQTSSLKPYVLTMILEKIIIDLEDEVVNLLEKEKTNLKTIESLKSKGFGSSENAISESKNQSEKECDQVENSKVIAPGMFKLNFDNFSSVRRPKQSSVIWKQKGSSNTSNVDLSSVSHSKLNKDVKRYSRKDLLSCNNSHLRETSSAYVCNDAMNVFCNSRLCDSFDENNLFIFDDESVRISLVSKMPFRKKPRDSLNVRSKRNSNKSLPRTMHRWLPKMQPLAKPVAKWILRIVQICLWIVDLGCSKHMTGNRTLLTNFVEKFLGTVRFGNNDFAMIAGYGDVRNRTLVEAARTMLTFANLPLFLWAEAIATACFTKNRSIIHKSFDKTPYELMNKRKPNIEFFHVFRCRCYLLNDYEDVGKLKAKGDIGVFVGYSKESAAFRIYNKRTRKIHESVNVNFDEISKMASKQFSLEPSLSNLNKMGNYSNPSVSQVSETSKKDLEDLFQKFYDEYFDASKIMKSSTTNVETSNAEIPSHEEVFHESSESFQEESSLSSLNDDVQQSLEEVKESSSSSLKDDVQQSSEEVGVPSSNTQSVLNNMVPNVDEASTSHNVFSEHLEDAYFDASIDYDETFAQVAQIESIRLFLAYAAHKDFTVFQMDVKIAFLNRILKEEVYVGQPSGFVSKQYPDHVYALDKALYGLKQAPQPWYGVLSQFLIESGFQKEKIIIDLEDKVVSLLEKEKANIETIESLKSKGFESSENAIFETENQSENDCQVVKKECDNVENPKKKGSSNTSNVDLSSVSHLKLNKDVKRYSRKDLSCNNSHFGETTSAYVCNDAMNVSCNSRLCDLFDENNLFTFDDESVRISPVSKMPFKKKLRDSMNHMTGNRALLTNFVEKFLGTVPFGNNDYAVIAGYGDVVIGLMTIKKVYYVEGLTVFLNGILKEEVYVAQPLGFVSKQYPAHVYPLDKALYSLKQAPRASLIKMSLSGKKTGLDELRLSRAQILWAFKIHIKNEPDDVNHASVNKDNHHGYTIRDSEYDADSFENEVNDYADVMIDEENEIHEAGVEVHLFGLRKSESIHQHTSIKKLFKESLWKCAAATTTVAFERCMNELKRLNVRAHAWLNKIPAEH